jgi:hypothetical protein
MTAMDVDLKANVLLGEVVSFYMKCSLAERGCEEPVLAG